MGSRSPHGGRRVPDIMNGNKRDRGRRPPSRSCSPHDTKRSSPGATVAKDTEKDGCKSCSRSHTKSSCSDSSDSDAESQNSQAVDAEAVVNAETVETTSLAAAGAAAATAVMGKSLEVKANEELEDTGKQSNEGVLIMNDEKSRGEHEMVNEKEEMMEGGKKIGGREMEGGKEIGLEKERKEEGGEEGMSRVAGNEEE